MLDITAARELAIRAAEIAGNIALDNFDRPKDIRFKSRANPVTNVDLEAERAIVDLVVATFPQHNILSEEAQAIDRGDEFTWVIDPLDGTMNYSSGIPIFCVSIALARLDTPILGVVYDPIRKETFVGVENGGAFLNGKGIRVAEKESLQQANIGLDLGYQEISRSRGLNTMLKIRQDVQAFRLIGSAVLGSCYAACGRFDLYFHPSVYAWDLAASTIIAREAGAVVTEFSGGAATIKSHNFIIANPTLHAQFLAQAGPHLTQEYP
ncbi:MAG: inositol monophosphatase [Chloroflexi bacterium]|nr:inositol monophosphatase [Chloroflexota bacterium]